MNLVIDIGNTRIKVSIFENNEEIYFKSLKEFSIIEAQRILNDFHNIKHVIISSTRHIDNSLKDSLPQIFPNYIEFSQKTPIPFETRYRTQDTLGLDRIAAVAGAQYLHPNKNILIIDMGTAITYDFLSEKGIHMGGNISPGLKMRFYSLHDYTHKLPLVDVYEHITLLGDSTEQAIRNGVINGIIEEIEGTIKNIEKNYEDLTVLLTGGDAEFFEIKLKKSIFVVQNIVRLGLNIILKHNVATN